MVSLFNRVRRLERQVARQSARLSRAPSAQNERSLAELYVALALVKAEAALAAEMGPVHSGRIGRG